jgi:hypothetical protein
MGDDVIARILPNWVNKPRLNVSYPEVDGLKDKSIRKSINREIVKKIRKMILDQGYDSGDETRQIRGGYQVKLNDRGVLSIRLEVFSVVQGMIQGSSTVRAITFELKTGEVFKFKDLFNDDCDYVSRVNGLIGSAIAAQSIPLTTDFLGVYKNQDFYLTDSSLVIFFPASNYSPFTQGVPQFEVPYQALIDLAFKNGPIARLMKR